MYKDIFVIGTSAGGIEALRTLVSALPQDFPGSLFVVMHTHTHSPGYLAGILGRVGALPATCVIKHEKIEGGRIYVPPPDHHLLVEKGIAHATRGPKENGFRPAVDPLFRSAAQAYGPRVIGIVLTGGLDDGTAGLMAVKQLGGTAIVQDPADALDPSMPSSALRHVQVDHCVPLVEIAPLLLGLVRDESPVWEAAKSPGKIETEVGIAMEASPLKAGISELGEPSIYSCPDCQGVLLRVKSEGFPRFRCHVGHAYSVQSLLTAMNHRIEEYLWSTTRAIEEQAFLMQHLAEHAHERNFGASAEQLFDLASSARQRVELVRQAALQPELANHFQGGK